MGKNLNLISGNVIFDAGRIFSPGSNIELGGLSTAGEIEINSDGSLSFPENVAIGDISLQNGSIVSVNSGGGGNITVNARNFELQGSTLFAGINSGLGSPNAQAGDIKINATDNVFITGQDASNTLTSISNSVFDDAIGNVGNINIAARNIFFSNGSGISSFMSGQGNSGDITLNAQENISIDGSNDSIATNVSSISFGEGNSGTINVTAQNLTLSNGGYIASDTNVVGDSGDINLNIKDSLTIAGEAIFAQGALPSKIGTNLGFDLEGNPAKGNSGNINISTSKLVLSDNGIIDASTYGIGNAGNINIDATNSVTLDGFLTKITNSVLSVAEGNGGNIEISTGDLTLSNNATIDASTSGKGDAGNINIDTTTSITLDNSSSISSGIFSPGIGDGGNIEISTGDLTLFNNARIDAITNGRGNGGEIKVSAINLSLINGGSVIADTFGADANNIVEGNSGNININIADTLRIDGTTTVNFEGEVREVSGGIYASNSGNKIGDAGNISITANKLSLANGSQVNSFSRGIGNAGNITINAQDSILLNAGNELEVFTGISSGIQENGVGNAGNINITTNNLDVFNNTNISVSSLGSGDGGNILIKADSLNLNQNSIIDAVTSFGTGGNINLEVANKLSLDNNSTISARAFNNATGGNVDIQTNFIIAFPQGDNDILASAQQGNGGNITINAESLLGIAKRPLNDTTNDINASSQVTGLDGTINVNTAVVNPVQGVIQLPNNLIEQEQTTNQACQANRETAANNALVVKGKGGIPSPPDETLTSQNLIVIGQYTDDTYITPEPRQTNQDTIQPIVIGQYTDDTYITLQPIKTSVGMIQPARGIEVTSGGVVLTAYPTQGTRERTPQIKRNCG